MSKKAKRISVEQAYFLFSEKIHGHQDLGFLAAHASNGRVPVNIIETKKVPSGITVCFTPVAQPSLQRWAKIEHFLSPDGKPLASVL